MAGTLGCATTYQVLLIEEIVSMDTTTGQADYGRALGPLDDFSELVWDRRLDDISEATLTIPTNADCCSTLLTDVHVWHHGLAIYRDGVLVWDGPITRIETSRTQIVLVASDIMALMRKRLLPRDICFSADPIVCGGPGFTGLSFGAARSPEFVAFTLINEALTVDDHGAFVDLLSEGPELFEASYFQFGGPVYDLVQKLASDFINWTVLGRRIVISRGGLFNGSQFARASLLMCEDFVNDTFTTIEDGFATLTKDCQISDPVVTNGAVPTPAADVGCAQTFLNSEVADAYYGLLEGVQDGNRALAVGGGASPGAVLTAAAQNVLDGSYPPPVALSAENLQLSPNAPVTMAELVPGTIVPVIAECLCRPVSTDFILSKVTVTFNLDGERVEPTLIAAGTDNPGTFEEF